jgi:hypothetical protein
MALQSSGQISLNDIKTELGAASTNVSLRAMSNTAGKASPDAISEFYGYSAAQYYYWDLSNDIKWGSANDKPVQSNTEDFSMSLWIRPQWAATDLNLIIFDLTPSGTTSAANRFFLQYDYGLNRFNAMYRSNATNFNAQWALHSNNSATSTGTSSNDKWTAANRGDTNTDGFINLVLTYDASESVASNAFKVYWNNRLITSSAVSNNGTRSNMTLNELTFCGNDHNTGGSRIADYMYMHMWDVVLRAADITAMYNSGAPISATDANITTNLIFADSSESVPNTGDNDGSGNYSFVSANSQSIVVI